MAETATPATPETTMEQELEALFAETPKSADAPPAAPAVGATPAPSATSTEGAASSEPSLEDTLKTIEEPKADETPKATFTPEQERVLSLVPNAHEAERVTNLAQSYTNFTGAFESGDFDSVEAMFTAWKPEVYDAFLDHVYNRKVSSGEWVDRWIQEKELGPANKQISGLQRQIEQLKAQQQGRQQQEQSYAQQQATQRVAAQYTEHTSALFDQIKFSNADRRWVMADLNQRISANPQVAAELRAGRMGAVNGLFKAAVREYVQRDQIASDAQKATLAAQEKHKAPLQSTPTQEGALPDDVRQVPKEKLDEWEDQQLAQLFARNKAKR